MSTITATAETIATSLPGGSYFPFLNVEDLNHCHKTRVNTRIEQLRQEARSNGLAPRDVYVLSRKKICGAPETIDHVIAALHQLDVPILLLLNESTGWIETIDLHDSKHHSTLISCGKQPRRP